MELPRQGRSQMEFGNEEGEEGHHKGVAPIGRASGMG